MSEANPNRLWTLAWTVLWAGGCVDIGVREDKQVPEPDSRREIVILTPADSVSAPTDASDVSPIFFAPEGQFTVQVGVYRDAKRADQKVRELKDEGYPAYSVHGDSGVRVRIGYFVNRADADRFGRIFAEDRGVEYWIDRRTDE